MAIAVLDSVMTIIATATPAAIFPCSKWRHWTPVNYAHQCRSLSCGRIWLMLHNTTGSCEARAIRCPAIQRVQNGPELAAALPEVTGSIDLEHDTSGNTIQCPDSG